MWEISGNGLKTPSYLYGTMHVSNKLAFHLSDTFFIALKGADVVALESSPELWMQDIYAEQDPSSHVTSYLDNPFLGSFGNFYGGFSIDPPSHEVLTKALSTDPGIADQLLYRYGFQDANFEESTYLDLFIFQSAKKMQKPVASLEDVIRSEELYALSTMPDKDRDFRDYNYMDMYNIQDKIEDAYRNGDLDLMDSLTRLSNPSKNFRHYLINERNKIFVHSMDSIMKLHSLFTGVGAAHLPGDSGVITMLRNMGYRVRPVMAKVTKKSVKQMDDLQQMKLDLPLSPVVSNDSDFVMDAPGKLYTQSSYEGFHQQFYPDMVNGTYYMVRTMVTYAKLRGMSRADMMKSVDSLLYESVPGKILKKTEIISNNGYPGVDVTNRTKRGDIQRYRIFASDNVLYIFKLSSTGDHLAGKEGDKVMNSIKFPAEKNQGWKKIYLRGKSVEVEMPAGTEDLSIASSYYTSKSFSRSSTDAADSTVYLFECRWLDDYNFIEEDTFELRMMTENFTRDLGYDLVSSGLSVYNKYPCYDATFKDKNGKQLFVRAVLNGPAYYLMASFSKNGKRSGRFFNSLQFSQPSCSGKLKVYTDSTMKFSVNAMVDERKPGKWDSYRKLVEQYRKNYDGLSGRNRRYYYRGYFDNDNTGTMTFASPLSDEKVALYYFRYSEFYKQKDKADFWKHEEWNGMIVKKEVKEHDGITEMNVKLSDTASSRQILARIILYNDRMYSLYSCVDTINGPGEFVRAVFDSFKPLPDTAGGDIFSDKGEKYFRYLLGKDSLKRDKAIGMLSEVKIDDKHADDMLRYMQSDDFQKNDPDVRMDFYEKLGTLHTPSVIQFLSKKYKESGDSSSMQFAVLHALAQQQTTASYKELSDLLKYETPLTSEKEKVNTLFSSFYDSLGLSAALFPSFYELLRYPEYKTNVLDLLAALKDSGMIKPEAYVSQKSFFLKDANEELKSSLNDNTYNSGGNDALTMMNMQKQLLKSYRNMLKGYNRDVYDQLYGSNANRGDMLYDYSSLLIPYYDEEGAKKFYEKIFRSGSSDFKIRTAVLLLKNGKEVNDSIWKNYSQNVQQRVELYRALEAIGRLDKFDPKYKTQESITRALVTPGSSYYSGLYGNYNPEERTEKQEPDSVVFICKKYILNKEGKGYVYFYKSKSAGKKDWYLSYNGYQPSDTSKVNCDADVKDDYIRIDDETKVDKQIAKVMHDLALKGHRRTGEGLDYMNPNKHLDWGDF